MNILIDPINYVNTYRAPHCIAVSQFLEIRFLLPYVVTQGCFLVLAEISNYIVCWIFGNG